MGCPRYSPIFVQMISLAASVFLLAFGILSLMAQNGGAVDIRGAIVSIYLILFAIMLIIAEIRAFEFFGYVRFIYSAAGRGLFFIFLGFLCFSTHPLALTCGICLIVVGIIFVIFAFTVGGIPKPFTQRDVDAIPLSTDVRFVQQAQV
eukprot:GDKI01040599.1.p2 GENE.GDKI01040599.1~~GDKI01040599.1.p2  ORF type:complete len:148 (-),score=31.04 GDKI01040599.1:114-557(-)